MYDSFTSMSPEEERTFIPFEERMQTASKSATVVGFGLAGAIGALVIIIVLAFWGPIQQTGFEEGGEGSTTSAPK